MSAAPGLPGVPPAAAGISGPTANARLAPRPRRAQRPALRRRVVVGVALLVTAAVAVLVATGRVRVRGIRPRGASLPEAAPAQQRPPPAAGAAEVKRAPRPPPAGAEGRRGPDRVVAPTHAAALFAEHSWYVAPPPPPPAAPTPPPEPTAPPLPYTLVGSYAPEGDAPVFFLARGDRVLDVHLGDKLDGVYQLESAGGDQLVFVYLPLNVRQNLAARAAR